MEKMMCRNSFTAGILIIVVFLIGTISAIGKTASRSNKADISNWKIVKGNWSVEKGQLQVDGSDEQAVIFYGNTSRENYIVEVDVSFEETILDDCWISIVFRATPDASVESHVFVKPETSADNSCGFVVRKKSQWTNRKPASADRDFRTGKSRHVKLIVQGEKVTAFLDGDELLSSHYCVDAPSGQVGLGAYGCKASFGSFSITDLPDSKPIQRLENTDYLIIAHRGYSAKYPENTIASIKGGIDAGSDGIEFDVHRCASGEIVLIHDYTLERTTDGEGKIAEINLVDLQKLDAGSWKGGPFIGERVPTLDGALRVFENKEATAVIEVKAEDVNAKELAGLISSHKTKACVISFSQKTIKEIKQVDGGIRCGLLVGGVPEGCNPADWLLEQAKTLQCEVLSINYQILSPEIIQRLRENNVEVWAWTVNDIVIMQALVGWGINGITTDRPEARQFINN